MGGISRKLFSASELDTAQPSKQLLVRIIAHAYQLFQPLGFTVTIMLPSGSVLLAFLSILGRVRAAPTVTLDNATVTGAASGSINSFLGIPYAQPPYVDRFIREPFSFT